MLGNLMGGLSGVGSIVAVVGIAGLDKFEQDLGRMSRAVDGQAQFMRKSMNAAAVAGVATFMLSIDAAMKFESAFAGVVKTTDGLSDEFGRLNNAGKELAGQFRALALEIPVSVNELARIGELGGQLGVPKEELVDFTRTIANLGKTTNLSVEEGSTSIARFINITKNVAPAGMAISEQAERIGSTVVDLGNKMATTEAEIVSFAMRIAGAGGQVGMSQQQILSFGAALSSVGLNAEAGGTAISRLFIEMANTIGKGGARLEEFAKISKMSAAEFSAAFKKDAADATLAFLSGLNDLSVAGENIYPVLDKLDLSEIRLRDTITRSATARDILNKALVWGNDAYRENNAMTAEAQKRYETFESQMQMVKSIFNEAFIQLGENLLPALKSFTSIAKDNAGEIAAFVSVLGGAVTVLGTAALAMKGYRIATELATFASKAFTASLGPVGIAIAALGGAYYLYNRYASEAWKTEEEIAKIQTEQSAKIKALSERYDELTKNEGLAYAHQAEIRDVARQLRDAYAEAGIKVSEFGKSALDEYNQYIERIRPRLVDELDMLKKRNEYYLAASGADSGGAAFKKSLESGVFDSSEIRNGFETLRALRQETGLLSEAEKKAADSARDLANAEAEKARKQESATKAAEDLKRKNEDLAEWNEHLRDSLFDLKISTGIYLDKVIQAAQPVEDLTNRFNYLDPIVDHTSLQFRGLGESLEKAKKPLEEMPEKTRGVKSALEACEDVIERQMQEYRKLGATIANVSGEFADFISGLKDDSPERRVQAWGKAAGAVLTAINPLLGGIWGGITSIFNAVSSKNSVTIMSFEDLDALLQSNGIHLQEMVDGIENLQDALNGTSDVLANLKTQIEETSDKLAWVLSADGDEDFEANPAYIQGLKDTLESLQLIYDAYVSSFDFVSLYEEATGGLEYMLELSESMLNDFGKNLAGNEFFGGLLEEQIGQTIDAMNQMAYTIEEVNGKMKLVFRESPAFSRSLENLWKSYLYIAEKDPTSGKIKEMREQFSLWGYSIDDLVRKFGNFDDLLKDVKNDIESFTVTLTYAYKLITGQFSQFESDAKEIETIIQNIGYFKLDLNTTDLDERMLFSLKNMQAFIATLDPNSEAWRDADEIFRGLLDGLNSVGVSWDRIYEALGIELPPIKVKIAPEMAEDFDPERLGSVSGSVKIPDIWKDDSGSVEYWESVLEGLDEAYYSKYNEIQESLSEAQADLEELRAESALKLAKIDEEYSAKIKAKIADRTEIESSLYSMLGERAELTTSMRLQTTELRGDANEIRSFLRIMGEKTDLTVLRDVEDAVARITGETRDFTTGWDEMLSKLAGGKNEEFDKTTEAIGAASKALEDALYYGEDIDGTPFEDRINSLIWSAQNFANELNPDSQAFKDAQAAIGALTTKFYQAGGTMDKEAAAEAAKKWAEEMALAAEKQAAEIEEKGGFQLLKLDLDIAGIREQIDAVDEEISGLYEEWEQERIEVDLDISKAEANVAKLRNDLRTLRNDWYSDKFYLWIESGGAVGSDRRPTSVFAYADGGYIDSTQIALIHENEFVLSPDAVSALGKDKLESFNATADPRALASIDRSTSVSRSSRAPERSPSFSVVVREATPATWVEITDKQIHPRVTTRERKYKLGSNPYARS